jgi:GntR family transcriptional regulator/MocR family aminotransferase
VLSHERRLALLRWAATHDATIVEDDYDSQFRYARRPLEPLQRLDADGRVVYLGTFSKVLSPSLRLGFVVAPRSIVPALAALRSTVDWCPPWPAQPALTRFINDGHLDRHIVRTTRRYRARRDEVTRRLTVAPSPVRALSASAGLHIAVLVDADDRADDHAMHDASTAEDLIVGSLRRCYRFSPPPGGLLIGFGSVPNDRIGEAMDALDRRSYVSAGRRRHAPTNGKSVALCNHVLVVYNDPGCALIER